MKTVGISGSITTPSRTTVLTRLLLDGVLAAPGNRLVSIAELAPVLGTALDPTRLPDPVSHAFAALEAADIVIIATPVYKASYTGLLKHFLDLLDPKALRGKIAIVAATGGSERYALAVEHQLRPLLGFFGTHIVPASLFLKDSDFIKDESAEGGYRLECPYALGRLRLVSEQAQSLRVRLRDVEAA